ncbi:ATP-dependent DNA helicase RecQ-like isoform X2 [Dysidea avara]|uniref:ATP-dependent DNA helicase RecQ-like isoform X2 n=1 Tax=Dysidea avara TaxID=196820 RepID=UPI0033234225
MKKRSNVSGSHGRYSHVEDMDRFVRHPNSSVSGRSGSLAVVVSPLTSLMMDQRQRFAPTGISVEFVGEAQTDNDACTKVVNGEVQLVYISPESMLNTKRYWHMFQSDSYQNKMIAFVVDEAHCVKMWGDNFRVAFAKLGTLRSILPTSVNVMALTATATQEILKCVENRLDLKDVVLIGIHSGRPNIKFIVKPSIDLNDLAAIVSAELVELRTNTPKTVLFCRSHLQCVKLLVELKKLLKDKITEPPGMPVTNIHYRLIDNFTSGSKTEAREVILQEFCKRDTSLRLIIATNAFGLGFDCADITRIIHWGSPNTLEELAQQTGRAGRDGSHSEAILYKKSGKHTSRAMKTYVGNVSVCRRKLLFQGFLFGSDNSCSITACRCCDLCAPLCNCHNCTM